jgi:hypothetical protein
MELDEVARLDVGVAGEPLHAAVAPLGGVVELAGGGGLDHQAVVVAVLEAAPDEGHAPEDAVLAELAAELGPVDGVARRSRSGTGRT